MYIRHMHTHYETYMPEGYTCPRAHKQIYTKDTHTHTTLVLSDQILQTAYTCMHIYTYTRTIVLCLPFEIYNGLLIFSHAYDIHTYMGVAIYMEH